MGPHGFFRVVSACPQVHVANPAANVREICRILNEHADADVWLFPELCITGYTCGDLFAQDSLLEQAKSGLESLIQASVAYAGIVVVGMPLQVGPSLYNVALCIQQGEILAAVPKRFLATYREFYEARWFRAADGTEPNEIELGDHTVPFGIDLLLSFGEATLGIEICEDLWTPIPPSSQQALAGADVLLNLSASNDVVGKSSWRRELVCSQSGRCLAAYVYASAGPGESTTDLVFGGHCLIAENGRVLHEDRAMDITDWGLQNDVAKCEERPCDAIAADLDLQKLKHERRVQTSFHPAGIERSFAYRVVHANPPQTIDEDTWQLNYPIDPQPFVPKVESELRQRCREIIHIQSAGLCKRLSRLPEDLPLVIGVSGGLDSTLALLVACHAVDQIGIPRRRICGYSMPGFGTSRGTRSNAERLMSQLEVESCTVDVRELCLQSFVSLEHAPFGIDPLGLSVDEFQRELQSIDTSQSDLVFENVQARTRTMLLMSAGFVLGTGDLSEQALGWSTYNGDHMSMYNVNTSIPKTLVRFLVEHIAREHAEGPLRETLLAIAETPISPELLPLSSDGEIQQSTEAAIGPYELHDFFLYHFVRFGFSREKIVYLAAHAEFSKEYDAAEIAQTLDRFLKRFFQNQFKRSCVPDGPKVGTVSLSPRGDWRMPSDADHDAF